MRRYDDGVCIFKNKLDEFRKNNELGEIISVRVYLEAGNDYCGIFPRLMTEEAKPDAPPLNIAPKWVPEKYKISYEQLIVKLLISVLKPRLENSTNNDLKEIKLQNKYQPRDYVWFNFEKDHRSLYNFIWTQFANFIQNRGDRTFLKKWGITTKFFKKYYLKSKTIYTGPLSKPKITFFYLVELTVCKIRKFFTI